VNNKQEEYFTSEDDHSDLFAETFAYKLPKEDTTQIVTLAKIQTKPAGFIAHPLGAWQATCNPVNVRMVMPVIYKVN
jgi:hypothetical protein